MKNNSLSILEYYARKALPRALIVLAVMAAAEMLYIGSATPFSPIVSLQEEVNFMLIVYTAARLLIFFLIGGPSAGKSNYLIRMRMLNVTENKAFRLNIFVNIMVYVIAWAVQQMLVLYLAKKCTALPEYTFGPQGFFSLLVQAHGGQAMLPTDRFFFWVTCAAELLSLSIGSACFRFARMYRRFPAAAVIIVVLTIGTQFYLMVGSYALVLSSFAMIIAWIGYFAQHERANNRDENKEAAYEN